MRDNLATVQNHRKGFVDNGQLGGGSLRLSPALCQPNHKQKSKSNIPPQQNLDSSHLLA